jgi:hypothetical protein
MESTITKISSLHVTPVQGPRTGGALSACVYTWRWGVGHPGACSAQITETVAPWTERTSLVGPTSLIWNRWP